MYTGIKEGDWTPLLEQFNGAARRIFGSNWTDFWEDVGEQIYDSFHSPIEKVSGLFEDLFDKIEKFNSARSLFAKTVSGLAEGITGSSAVGTVTKVLTGDFSGAAKDIWNWGKSKLTGHAKGGIITHPIVTTSGDLFGEDGQEAVVPLENNTGWTDILAGRIAELIPTAGSESGYAPIILDGREVGRFCIKAIEDDKRRKGY